MTRRISATKRGAPLAERITLNSEPDESGCWLWKLSVDQRGYPRMCLDRRRGTVYAHRVSYSEFVGPIPTGMTVDHLCFVPACVNPDHLSLLSREGNAARQRRALAQFCQRGHEFTADNTGWQKNRHRYGAEMHRFLPGVRSRDRPRPSRRTKERRVITIPTAYTTATAITRTYPEDDVVIEAGRMTVYHGAIVFVADIPEAPLTEFAHGYLSRRAAS